MDNPMDNPLSLEYSPLQRHLLPLNRPAQIMQLAKVTLWMG